MKYPRILTLMTFAVLVGAGLCSNAFGQSNDGNLANLISGGSSIRFDVLAQHGGASLTITAPDGRSFTKEFKAGSSPGFELGDKSLPDGSYGYELRLGPVLSAGQRDALKDGRGKDDEPEAERAARKRPVLPNMIQSGAFAVINGQVIVGGLSETQRTRKATAAPASKPASNSEVASGNTAARLRNHRASLFSSLMFDQVIPDDLIVQGSACIGLDCVNNESFGFDTIRLKENNTRIKFDDTSVSAGFPANDWQLTANDSGSGGANKFSIEDITGSKVPFTVTAGAPTNSMFVDSTGRLGLRTSTPVLDIHAATSNTPALRLEQNNSGGFNAQTWDIGANEANFFVRDVTSGSLLPFRIRPGAPTSSIDISSSGKVGIGTASPTSQLTVKSAAGFMTSANTVRLTITGSEIENSIATSGGTDLGLDTSGNFAVRTSGTAGFGVAASRVISLNVTNYNNCTGFTSAGAILACTVSDERVKHGINPFAGKGLSVIRKIQPITFQFNRQTIWFKNDRTELGLSAQNLRAANPLLASSTGNETGALLQPEPLALHAVEIDAIKQLDARLTALEKENARLRKLLRRRK